MLEIQNVSKTFNAGTVNEKTALNGLNLKLNEGDFVTVIGGNGAGKSTMLNAVAGVWPVDCGKIIIDGVDVTRLSEHQRAAYIGRVFQDPMTGTAATMQIEENLALAARRGKPRTLRIGITRAEREQYRELLKSLDLGLENRLTARVGLLSGGQRQALTLLMATMNKPKLLLLDEHTAALDPKTALKVLTLSAKIVEENHLTTMMITHNMKDAIKYGNRLIMMHEGHIIYDVSGEEKKNLQVSDLLAKFQIASGGEFANDRMSTLRVAAPSVCFAAARILLAAAPTAPPCFRHWRRSSLLRFFLVSPICCFAADFLDAAIEKAPARMRQELFAAKIRGIRPSRRRFWSRWRRTR